jgi:uncharacterized protein (DUF2236 family)
VGAGGGDTLGPVSGDGAGLFPPDAVIRRVDGEGLLLAGAGRALLMQLAHPSVAQGVADHSDFERDLVRRLQGTLRASYRLVFGTRAEAEETVGALRAVHHRVTGPSYTANDPDLLLWVHATLVDTALLVYTTLVAPLGDGEVEEFYEQSAVVAELLGCPRSRQPRTIAEFHGYVRDMACTIEVTPTARRLARSLFHPRLRVAGSVPVSWIAAPALALVRFITVGTLPEPIRTGYGFTWDGRRSAALWLASQMTRRTVGLVPASIRRVA